MKKIIAIIAVVLLASVLCFCFVACVDPDAEQKALAAKTEYNVGIIQLVTHDALDAATKGFQDALKAEIENAGKTVHFDYQNASGDSGLCTTIANSFVSKGVDLIMANATAALQAAANATLKTPILGTSITDYGEALKITDFNGTAGGNISGTSDLALLEDQAKMIVELLPTDAKKVALLYCSSESNSDFQVKKVKAYLEGLNQGYICEKYTFTDSNDITSVCNRIVADGCKAVYIPTDNTAASNGDSINTVLGPARIPIFAGEEGICKKANGIVTLSISYYNIGVKTGKMAAQILLGKTKISTMPIQYDEAPVKKYNAARCAELGITVPSDYVALEVE